MHPQSNIRSLALDIQNRQISVEALITASLEKAITSVGVFMGIRDETIEEAMAVDAAIRAGEPVPALSGVPVTLKDLFDIRGEITLAGSTALKQDAKPAARDCDVVASLRRGGLLFPGRTTMSEFAFSGMGLNPHYGTPMSIWDRETGRLPGGSSSGSAVSVAEGIVPATMGSDTAGSCRIPAAFNGIVGVKPSYGRLSLRGVYPLSPTSDAPGPMAVDVDSCFILDQLITGAWDGTGTIPDPPGGECSALRLVVPESIVLEELDAPVVSAFEAALAVLEDHGAEIRHQSLPLIDQCVDMFLTRSVVGYEAWHHHREMMERYGDDYDPFVFQRIHGARGVTEEEQRLRYAQKAELRQAFSRMIAADAVDAVIYPTVPCLPPAIADAQNPKNTARINLRCLRNTASANYFDGCSVSLPCSPQGEAPVGLMVSAAHGQDDRLYGIAFAMEKALSALR